MFATVKAYVLKDYRWPSATTTFNVDIPEADGLWNTAFEAAMARWNDATIFDFRIRRDTYEDPCNTGDSENGVGFADDVCGEAFGENTLAVEQSWTRGNRTTQSNIHFNNAYSWNVYDGPYKTGGWDGIEDFRRVAVHELGHALGLLHEESTRSIMAAELRWGSTIVAPQADDIAGVAALYLEVPQITHKYVFPQFAFGGGWQSILMMLGPHGDTSCTFTAEGRYIETDGPQGVELDLSFNNTWMLLKTTAPPSQAASSGMAILDCDKEVLVNVLFSLRVSGSVVGEALVEPAEELAPGESAYFIADHTGGGRLALAVANPSPHPLPVRVRLFDGNNVPPSAVNTTVDIPANSAKAFFLDELGTIPEDHVGLVQISASRPVYAIGLKTTGPSVYDYSGNETRAQAMHRSITSSGTSPRGGHSAMAGRLGDVVQIGRGRGHVNGCRCRS